MTADDDSLRDWWTQSLAAHEDAKAAMTDTPWHDILWLTEAEKGMVSKINPFDNGSPVPVARPQVKPSAYLPPATLVGGGGAASCQVIENHKHLYIDGHEILNVVEERAYVREARR